MFANLEKDKEEEEEVGTLASLLKPLENLTCMNPCIHKRGTIARISRDSSQFAEKAMERPHTIVLRFCTTRAKLSPTIALTDAASVDSRAPKEPLHNIPPTWSQLSIQVAAMQVNCKYSMLVSFASILTLTSSS
jgi:hypothetical protein